MVEHPHDVLLLPDFMDLISAFSSTILFVFIFLFFLFRSSFSFADKTNFWFSSSTRSFVCWWFSSRLRSHLVTERKHGPLCTISD